VSPPIPSLTHRGVEEVLAPAVAPHQGVEHRALEAAVDVPERRRLRAALLDVDIRSPEDGSVHV
jgi:hypothetical protein